MAGLMTTTKNPLEVEVPERTFLSSPAWCTTARLSYLDSASSSLQPRQVLTAMATITRPPTPMSTAGSTPTQKEPPSL